MSDPTYRPIPSTDPPAPTEPTPAKSSRGNRVLAGAALVAAGLVAGGATYAVTSQIAPTSDSSTVQPGAPGE